MALRSIELMIGDWVRGKSCGHCCGRDNNNYYTIATLDISNHCWGYSACGSLVELQYEDIEPVPLTKEILLKNEWKYDEYHTYLCLVVGSIHLCWGFYENCLSVSDWSDIENCQITSVGCQYVHQLQHAIRLCGIDKEIIIK